MSFSSTIAGVPVDPFHSQEPAVEPRAQQFQQVVVEDLPLRMRRDAFEDQPAHLDQRRRRAGRRVETAEQLRAQRFRRFLQADQVFGNRVRPIGVGSLADGVGRWREGLRQHIEELFALALAERLVAGERFAGERHAGDLAVLAE
jgi:hypothetical protein